MSADKKKGGGWGGGKGSLETQSCRSNQSNLSRTNVTVEVRSGTKSPGQPRWLCSPDGGGATARTRPPTGCMTVITDNNLPLSETHGCQERSDFWNLDWRRRPLGHIHQICIPSAFSCPRHVVSVDLVPSQLTTIINYTTGSVWMYSKLKSGLPAEQIQLADMIPGMFLEACANDSEHIAARCWMRCSNQSNQPPLSRGCNEALSSRRLVSVGKMKHVSSSNEAKIKKKKKQLQAL